MAVHESISKAYITYVQVGLTITGG